MEHFWELDVEERWKECVRREAKIKGSRYPWNVEELGIADKSTPPAKTKKSAADLSLDLSDIKPAEREVRLKLYKPNYHSLNTALDCILKGIDDTELEIKSLKKFANPNFLYGIKKY